MTQGDIASSIYRNDPFIRLPARWMRVSGPRLAVLFVPLGFVDVVAIAPYVGNHPVDIKSDWAGLSISFGLRPLIWGIYGWMPGAIASVLSQLQTSGVVRGQDERYEALVRSSCQWLGTVWLTAVAFAFAFAFGVGSQFVIALFFDAEAGVPSWGNAYDLRFWLFAAPVGAITWYAIAKVLVRATLFSLVLIKLFGPSSSMVVTIPPMHPDGAGGLGIIGRYAVGMSLLAVAALGFISVLAIRSVPADDLAGGGLRSIHFVLSLLMLYPLLVWLYLFAPLWLVNQAILKARYEELLDVSTGLGKHRDALNGAGSATDDLTPRLDRIRQLEEAYALIIRTSPRWPFSRTTLGYLGAVNLLGLASTILAIALTIQRIFHLQISVGGSGRAQSQAIWGGECHGDSVHFSRVEEDPSNPRCGPDQIRAPGARVRLCAAGVVQHTEAWLEPLAQQRRVGFSGRGLP